MADVDGDGTAVTGLGGPSGYGEIAIPRGDTGAVQVDLSAVFENGFVIDGVTYPADEVYISTDGFITFGTPVEAMPEDPASLDCPFIAVFMADVDTREDGEAPESGQIWLDIDPEADCVTITWEDVGFYRRNATETNTFQVQLYDNGDGTFDVVFRYEDIDWTSGDLQGGWGGLGGTPAVIGYRMSSSGEVTVIAASGDEEAELDLPFTPGNTGVPGLYIFTLGGGEVLPEIRGTEGDDVLDGTSGDDLIRALGGDDIILTSLGADQIDGGAGFDAVDYYLAEAGVKVDLTNAANMAGAALGDVLIGIEAVIGSDFADTITGSLGGEQFSAEQGNDSIKAGDGGDTIWGGAGLDTINGEGGHDLIYGGNDNDKLTGAGGKDTVAGGSGRDTITGDGDADSLKGEGDADSLSGGDGNDILLAGSGNDTLTGGAGVDSLKGDDGADSLTGGDGNDAMNGGSTSADGNDTLRGDAGDDRISGYYGNDLAYGGDGNDSLTGDPGKDQLYGDAGKDTLNGGGDADVLLGGPDADFIYGGGGNDKLYGGGAGDSFWHTGSSGDGTDLVYDYGASTGDVLVCSLAGATKSQFKVSYVTVSGAGSTSVKEANIIYTPTGQVLWTVVDGADDTQILLKLGSSTYDLV